MTTKRAPKKSGRDLERTRQEILSAAFPLIFRNGFQGVSIDQIVAKTRLTKGAFYHIFPTKLDLGYALVDEVIKPMTLSRWIEPLARTDDPLEGVLERLRTLIGGASPAQLKLGCPLNNLVQEMAPLDREFKRRLKAALELWVDGMATQLKRAQRQGQMRPDVDARKAAHFIVMAHEGFYGMLKGLSGPAAFPALMQSLELYFQKLRNSPQPKGRSRE